MFAQRWTLYSWRFDTFFFFLPFIVMFIFLNITSRYFPGILYPELSPLWFFFCTIVFDVGHVWGTIYRTYLRKEIVSKHKKLLTLVPIVSLFILFLLGNIHLPWHDVYFVFFSFLAYMAVFHFIKQQVWFIALYGGREENLGKMNSLRKKGDAWMTWVITGFPFIYWIMNYDNIDFEWFTKWEFTLLTYIVPHGDFLWLIYAICIMAYIIVQLWIIMNGGKVNPLKYLYMIGTAYIWYNGMVVYNSAIAFWLWNILLHGLNYYGITIWSTMKVSDAYPKILEKIKRLWVIPVGIFISLSLISIWYIEEFLWDQFLWKERSMIFSDIFYNIWYNPLVPVIIMSILGTAQLTHYILDRYIWRKEFWEIF